MNQVKYPTKWSVLIVDDDEAIHENSEVVLNFMVHKDRGVETLHAYSAKEAVKTIAEHEDIAVIVLDIMMEDDDLGLSFVKFLRDELKNEDTRVLLYTGESEIAPKSKVSNRYRIDAYLDKNKTCQEDWYASVRLALRTYSDRLRLRQSTKKDDVTLLSEIASMYIKLLDNPEALDDYREVVDRVGTMVLVAGDTGFLHFERLKEQAATGLHEVKTPDRKGI